MKPSLLLFAVLSAVSTVATAQDGGAGQPSQAPRWGLGVGAAVSDSVYAGEGTRVTPFPLVSYEGERLFWRGISGGAHLLRSGGFTLDATLSARVDGIDRDDFGRTELAARGVDRSLLEDRDDGADLGLAGGWRGAAGQVEVGVKGDITSASKGYEASLKYGYPVQWGRTKITPNVGVSHLSKKLANYYFGTLPQEVARGLVDYRPGSATVARIGIDVVRPFAERWVFIGNVSYKRLPGKLADSPLVEKDTDGVVSAFIGVSRGF
ncbi:outer membrane protein [Duganella sp. CF517]|uniref:MipA/OmpV family protein n=1 Tax=Duganella sp. CF517 TaxID=1881038 RepID=UPI0008D2C225|nr:MipA/OmpV family protein [Duganella sp. CF517]SEN06920.1 outer membrane protein [Duganella sp. CF517]